MIHVLHGKFIQTRALKAVYLACGGRNARLIQRNATSMIGGHGKTLEKHTDGWPQDYSYVQSTSLVRIQISILTYQ